MIRALVGDDEENIRNGLIRQIESLDLGIQVVAACLLYTSPSPRDRQKSRMPSSA